MRSEEHTCHVLRYTQHFQKMREIIQSGVLGQIIDVAHRENVSFWHMAHSYVRGNWRSKAKSSPMILAKCCHDLDILPWLLDRKCLRLSSSGALNHFCVENAPDGAPARCTDGCPASESCPYYAPWVYQDLVAFWRSFADTASGFDAFAANTYLKNQRAFQMMAKGVPFLRQVADYRGWPLTVLAGSDPTPDKVAAALREGPYGRCVYRCDNDVVDHQVVLMQFEDNITVTLTMHGHSHIEYRTTRIEGSRGRLMAEFGNGGAFITVDDHRSGRTTRYDTGPHDHSGHGGGDAILMEAFVNSLSGNPSAARSTARQALTSHLMAFAAEQARLQYCVMEAEAFA